MIYGSHRIDRMDIRLAYFIIERLRRRGDDVAQRPIRFMIRSWDFAQGMMRGFVEEADRAQWTLLPEASMKH